MPQAFNQENKKEYLIYTMQQRRNSSPMGREIKSSPAGARRVDQNVRMKNHRNKLRFMANRERNEKVPAFLDEQTEKDLEKLKDTFVDEKYMDGKEEKSMEGSPLQPMGSAAMDNQGHYAFKHTLELLDKESKLELEHERMVRSKKRKQFIPKRHRKTSPYFPKLKQSNQKKLMKAYKPSGVRPVRKKRKKKRLRSPRSSKESREESFAEAILEDTPQRQVPKKDNPQYLSQMYLNTKLPSPEAPQGESSVILTPPDDSIEVEKVSKDHDSVSSKVDISPLSKLDSSVNSKVDSTHSSPRPRHQKKKRSSLPNIKRKSQADEELLKEKHRTKMLASAVKKQKQNFQKDLHFAVNYQKEQTVNRYKHLLKKYKEENSQLRKALKSEYGALEYNNFAWKPTPSRSTSPTTLLLKDDALDVPGKNFIEERLKEEKTISNYYRDKIKISEMLVHTYKQKVDEYEVKCLHGLKEGESRNLCLMYIDTISELENTKMLQDIASKFSSICRDRIQEYEGSIYRDTGCSLYALFRPDQVLNALKSAVAIDQDFNNFQHAGFQIGIVLSCGEFLSYRNNIAGPVLYHAKDLQHKLEKKSEKKHLLFDHSVYDIIDKSDPIYKHIMVCNRLSRKKKRHYTLSTKSVDLSIKDEHLNRE